MTSDDESILLRIGDRTCELSRADAAELQDSIGTALTEKREFFRTAGEHRDDGSYVVSRRSAESAGNAKVFESFESLRRLYDRLPREFTAEDVGRTGITGSRRHMLIRHFGEHPAFDCRITRRNPLTAERVDADAGSAGGDVLTEADATAD